jgi:DNA ligase (NAD+)
MKALANHDLNSLRSLIDKADSAYYRAGIQEYIPDALYDQAKERLRSLCPTDERLSRIGLPFDPSELRSKTKHGIPMGSLDNLDGGIEGFDKWFTECGKKLGVRPSIVVSHKVDGGSIRVSYVDGVLKKIVTRGNGEYGEDITANGVNFQYLPAVLPEPLTCDVRGEAVLYKEDFRSLKESEFGVAYEEIPEAELSNPRNVGNGILGRDSGEGSGLIRFIAFNIFGGFDSELEKFAELTKLGFQVVEHKVVTTTDELREFYDHSLLNRRSLPYEIDGLVVSLNLSAHQAAFITEDPKSLMRPKFSRAIKFPHMMANTRLVDINLSIGHTGAIVPVAVLEEVRIGGVNVENALLNNWEEIDRLGIAIGDLVTVILAGDIIPKIIGVAEESQDRIPIVEPSNCPYCNSPTTRELRGKPGVVTYCSNPKKCPEVSLEKIKRWVGDSKRGVGILGIGSSIIEALWGLGILKDVSDLYTLTVEDLKDVELGSGVRVGESRARTIIKNIDSKRVLPIHTFLGCLGIELLGRRRIQILSKAAEGRLDTLDQWLDTKSFGSLVIEGLGEAIKQSVIDGIEFNRDLINRLLSKGVVVTGYNKENVMENEREGKVFAGLSFCLTGTRECLQDIERLGGQIKSGVSKDLSFLVQKDPMSSSSKTLKAEKYGVRVISIDFLKKVISGEEKL